MFSNVNELVKNTKDKIDNLHTILDVLLAQYRIASDVIDRTLDHRQKYTDLLLELNSDISAIVDTHPAIHVDKSWQNATETIKYIASSGEKIESNVFGKNSKAYSKSGI